MLSLLAQNVINVTDTAFLGRLGEVELGASAIAGVFYFMFFLIGIGFNQGVQIFIGRRNGEQNYFMIGRIVGNSITMAMVFAVIMFSLVTLFLEPLLQMVMKSERVYEASVRFMNVRVFGLFFIYPITLFRTFYIGIQNTKIMMWNAAIMAFVNVVLDYGLIFGNLGLPAMGIEGAALASVIAEGVALCHLLLHLYYKVDRKKYDLRLKPEINVSLIRELLSVSSFLMVQMAIALTPWVFFFIAIEQLGERPLAISNVLRSLYALFFIPIDSLAVSSSTIVSNVIGEGGADKVKANVGRIIRLGLAVIVPILIISAFIPRQILQIYTSDPSLIAESITPFYSLLTCIVFGLFGRVYFNALVGTGDTKLTMQVEMFAIFCYTIYMYIIVLLMRSPVWVCWTTEHVYWILMGMASFVMLRSGKWRRKTI